MCLRSLYFRVFLWYNLSGIKNKKQIIMISKILRSLFAIGLFALLSLTAFAEGDVVCSGRIMGQTTEQNFNEGQIWFDSPEEVVDVSIIGGTLGLAPASRADAACVSEATGTLYYDSGLVEDVPFAYEYKLEEYAWNDNLGFINFLGHENIPYSNYAVVVGPEYDDGGVMYRDLAGYAWSGSSVGPAFGYIQFKGEGHDVEHNEDFAYGVRMREDGALSGHAWTEAYMFIDFSGVYVELPGEEVLITSDYCSGEFGYMCVDVSLSAGVDDYWYDLDVYLMEDDGVTPLDLEKYSLEVRFVWEDTVKLNQLAFSSGDFSKDDLPINNGGGILQKPLYVADSEAFLKLFVEVKDGHYQLKEKIRSVAPTSNSNTSLTTSTLPPLPFNNEFFVDELFVEGIEEGAWTGDIKSNDLVLERIDYEITETKGGGFVAGGIPVYPGGMGNGYKLEFDPIVEVDTLYVADYQDEIIGYRNIPVTFTIGASSGKQFEYSGAEVYVILDYDEFGTVDECSEGTVANFDYRFVVEGVVNAVEVLGGKEGNWSFNPPVDPNLPVSAISYSIVELGGEILLSAVAELPEYDPEAGLPCDVMQGPTLYTVVKYEVPAETKETVYYYSNKLPRLMTAAYNPAAVIHGNVYAPKAFSPTASHAIQETGNLAIDVIRNTINENLSKYLGEIELSGGDPCTIEKLSNGGVGSNCDGSFEQFEVGDEYVLYFNGTDVHLDMGNPEGNSDLYGDWVLIVKDASIYIDSDIYHDDMELGKLVIVGLRSYEGECEYSNIYIHADVKNIDANIITDCSLFSYHPEVARPGADGFPDWDYEGLVQYLNKQKFFRGSIASRNTIGGADLDAEGLEYLLLGTGEVLELPVSLEERLRAQLQDLNYLAFFRLDVELAANGLPIDQRCQKALTIEDMVQIQEYFAGAVDEFGDPVLPVYGEGNPPEICDGIDLKAYDPGDWSGDLVVAGDDVENLARGLPEGSFSPVYIHAVSSGSFIFEKAGEVTSWN